MHQKYFNKMAVMKIFIKKIISLTMNIYRQYVKEKEERLKMANEHKILYE